jgi:hypothetical protein
MFGSEILDKKKMFGYGSGMKKCSDMDPGSKTVRISDTAAR